MREVIPTAKGKEIEYDEAQEKSAVLTPGPQLRGLSAASRRVPAVRPKGASSGPWAARTAGGVRAKEWIAHGCPGVGP